MNSPAKLRGAVQWLCQSLTLDVDARVHVFELTIRALGILSLQESNGCCQPASVTCPRPTKQNIHVVGVCKVSSYMASICKGVSRRLSFAMQPASLSMGSPSQYAHSKFQHHQEAAGLLVAASSLPNLIYAFVVLVLPSAARDNIRQEPHVAIDLVL